MGIKLGMEGKLYRKSGASTWAEITNVKDLSLNMEKGEADCTTRANGGWKATLPTLKDASVEFQMMWDNSDVSLQAIRDAYLNNTPITMQVLDGDRTTAGTEGLQADFGVTKFDRKENREDPMEVDVAIKPTYSATPPQWITIP